MKRNLLKLSLIVAVTLALGVMTTNAPAQTGEELVDQLRGRAEAPARDAAELAEAYRKAVDYLLPLMSADNVVSRYTYQIMLQDMGSRAARPGAEDEREALARVMISSLEEAKMPDTVRRWFVLQLERIGKAESVPALAKLMSADDEHLRDCARRALEKNPDSSATDALLKALAVTKDARMRIGLINALGARRAEVAIEPLAEALSDSDPKIAAAAVTALSEIGGEDGARALFGVFETPVGPLHVKAAQGLIDIARRMVGRNDYATAATIYQAMYDGATELARDTSDVNPFSIRAAAVVGLMACDPEKGAERIAGLMRDSDPKIRAATVQAARQTPSKVPTRALTALLSELDPVSQVQVLGLIADRGDLSVVEPVKAVLNSSDESVRLAAIEALTRVGTDDSAEALFEAAMGGAGAVQKAAREGLAAMVGPRVEEVIGAHAASGDTSGRVVAIGLLGERRVPGSAETLLGYAADTDEDVSRAAFGALIDAADLVDVSALTDLVARTKNRAARDSGITALRAVVAQAADKDAAAAAVIERMNTADAGTRISLLTCLNAAGGSAALKAVCEAAQAQNQALREAGLRTLSEWPDFEAAETLVDIATKPETSLTHYVLAVRGALRLISISDSAPLDDRISLCLYTLDHARRDDEKRQAVAALGVLPGQQAVERLLALAGEGELKTEAGLAAVELAARMLRTDRQAARDLARKIRDLNISDEVNRRAESIISGRRRS